MPSPDGTAPAFRTAQVASISMRLVTSARTGVSDPGHLTRRQPCERKLRPGGSVFVDRTAHRVLAFAPTFRADAESISTVRLNPHSWF